MVYKNIIKVYTNPSPPFTRQKKVLQCISLFNRSCIKVPYRKKVSPKQAFMACDGGIGV